MLAGVPGSIPSWRSAGKSFSAVKRSARALDSQTAVTERPAPEAPP
jgi:hypothetical protein